MHAECYRWLRTIARDFEPHSLRAIVEIGSRNINGGARDLFRFANVYHGIDTTDGPGVDEIADGATFDPVFVPDLVIATEVFEHAPRWPEIVANAHRMLARGGSLVATCATVGRVPHSGVDGGVLRDGEWYKNVGAAGMAQALTPFAWWRIEVDATACDLRLVARKAGPR